MKINSIGNIYNNLKSNTSGMQNPFMKKNDKACDVISFSAKQYDIENIINQTNHCAYCGCKVYSEQQIESIAKEMLSSKFDKLQGKIKSALEKLDGAKHSEELALAKRLENEDEIEFFKNFLEIASKKPYLKGAAIFEQIYNQDNTKAFDTLKTNLKPLLKTVDHISPQNEEKDNNNSDINLVEACWCCNHDLKKGVPFIEFYTMYPSIKNNMPAEKFQAASSSILDFQSSGVLQRLSAANLLKTVQRLFIQRKEASTYMDSIDFRIRNSKEAICSAIETSHKELKEKENELSLKEQQFEEMKKDDEFRAILERNSLQKSVETQTGIISQLKGKSQHISNQINEIRNPSRKKTNKQNKESNKKEIELTPEQKKEKIEELKNALKQVQEQILGHEITKDEQETRIRTLNELFPTVSMMQHEKNIADSIISAHNQLTKINNELNEKNTLNDGYKKEADDLKKKIAELPKKFDNPETFDEETKAGYKRYLDLQEALNFIIEHPNGGGINALIKSSAKANIEKEMEELTANPLVIQYKEQQEKMKLEKEKSILDRTIENLNQVILNHKNNKQKLERTASVMSKEDAEKRSDILAQRIRSTNEKEQMVKLPQIIDAIKTEITLIKSTILDLEKKSYQIDTEYPQKS